MHPTVHDDDLIEAWSAHQQVRGFSPRTIARRRWTLAKLADAGPLEQHTADSIERFLAHWPSPQSRYSLRSDCHQFYRWAQRRGHLTGDPTDDVDPPRLHTRAATPLTATQLRRALEAANRPQRTAIMLGAWAGLRVSEIAALDAGDVHRDLGVLVVRDGKGGRDAVLPLADELAAVLPDHGPCVPYATGQAVGAAIRRAFRRAGIDRRPHDLRHTFGTAAARAAHGDVFTVAHLMRHASVTTTQRYVAWTATGADVVEHLYDAA